MTGDERVQYPASPRANTEYHSTVQNLNKSEPNAREGIE